MEKKGAAELSVDLFNRCAQQFKTKEELAAYAMAMTALGIALLRGIEGNNFVKGFLTGSIDEENPMVIKPQTLN